MSTPTKFSLGGAPRTRTGLIPTTYTQAADKMSMPNHYQQLATKPKPQKYRYRGDYINERNKKLLHERRLAEKQRLLDNSNETDSLLVSPRSRSLTSSTDSSNDSLNKLQSSDKEKELKWDSYCQHISCHKLSNDEALAKSENKKHFVSFLRSEAAKKKRENSPKKDKESEPAVVQKKKKPPVPRLSKLARTGDKKGKENNKNQTTSSRPASNGNLKESDNKKITSTTTTKLRYLDFISEKQTGDESPPTAEKVKSTSPEIMNSEKGNVDNDDASRFRTQIERIVERAAQMVLKDNTSSTSLDESTVDDTNEANDSSLSIAENKKQPNEAITDTVESSSQLQSQKLRLELLEEQVRSMSSSTTDSLVFSSSTIDQDMKERYSSGQRDGCISCTSSVTEILPRSHVQPMSALLVWQQCFGQGIDSSSSSYTGNSYLTELDSSSTLLDIVSESKQYTQSNEYQEDIDDQLSCIKSTNETVTEVEPRLLSVQPSIPLERIQPSLETCPEETAALPHINPSTEPSREWDEPEPLPRGYEYEQRQDDYQDTFDIDIDDIIPRSAVNKGRSEILVDDLFSLL